jgi:TetR/AcrR family transcriptional regulator
MAQRSALAPPTSREKILDVAERLFARGGYEGVGLREVAEQVGLGKSSLFHHFNSKDQLYCEVLARVLGRIRLHLDPVVNASISPADKLVRWVETLVDALAEQPTTARLLMRELVEDEQFRPAELPEAAAAQANLAGILRGIRELLEEGVARGVFRPVSVPQTIQTLIGATVYHFASGAFGDKLLGRPLLSAQAVKLRKRELVDLLQQGLVA